jgi:hypothetical protein
MLLKEEIVGKIVGDLVGAGDGQDTLALGEKDIQLVLPTGKE